MMRVRPSRIRWGIAALMAAAGVALAPASAQAHPGNQSYVYLNVGSSELVGRIEFPFTDVEEVFGVNLPAEGPALQSSLDDIAPELHAYADDHFTIGEDWPIIFEGIEQLETDPESDKPNYVLLPFTVDVDFAEVPRGFSVTYDPFFDEIPGRDALLLVENDWSAGVIENESESLVRFTADSRTQDVQLDNPSAWKNVTTSMSLGVDHIRTGPDHILFVLVLLLPAVLVVTAAGWEPARSFGSALWRVLKIASMFTLAHTITFTLAGMDLLPLPPSKFTETVIAVSIAAVSLNNVWPVVRNREWLIAFGFGLFHGMGFAGLVDGLDVSDGTKLMSLIGRNIGIEIGQVVVILLAFPALFLLRRTRLYRPLMIGCSIALAIVSILWMIERIAETDTGINNIVEPVVRFPRILIPVAIATLLAAAWWAQERSASRLLPVADEAEQLEDVLAGPRA